MLRILGRGREHNVGAARAAGARLVRQRHVLPLRSDLHYRLLEVLQTGDPTVLPHQACVRLHYYILTGMYEPSIQACNYPSI